MAAKKKGRTAPVSRGRGRGRIAVPTFAALVGMWPDTLRLILKSARGNGAQRTKLAYYAGACCAIEMLQVGMQQRRDRTFIRTLMASMYNEANQFLFPGTEPVTLPVRLLRRTPRVRSRGRTVH